MPEETKKPVKQIRSGALAVAIWKREHNGEFFYNVTPSRAYKEPNTEEWKYSESLDYFDLPVMGELLSMAFIWITAERAKAAEKSS